MLGWRSTRDLHMSRLRRRLLALLFALPACLARADDVSHDEILAAVRRGEIRPLAEIEASLRARLPGGADAQRSLRSDLGGNR